MNSTVIAIALVIIGTVAFWFYKTKCSQCCPTKSDLYVRQISAEELKKEMESNKDLVIVNTLAAEYYNDCRIPNSINMDYQKIELLAAGLDKSKDYVLYCASAQCPASKEAYKKMVGIGFRIIRAYEGGMKEWKEKGYPTEGACAMSYLK